MLNFLLVTCLLVGATLANPKVDPDEGLRNFVVEALEGFTAWIAQEEFDPTPPTTNIVNFELSNDAFILTGHLSNISAVGLSGQMDFNCSDTSFVQKQIDCYLTFPKGGLLGTYDANGSVLGLHPIGGDSTWEVISAPYYVHFKETYDIERGYIVMNDRFIDVLGAAFHFEFDTLNGTFKDMFTPETVSYEREILEEFASRLPSLFDGYPADLFLMYRPISTFLQSWFSDVKVSDIIEWPPTANTTTTTRARGL